LNDQIPWVNADACGTSEFCTHGTYDPTKSSSSKLVSEGTFDINYADGTEVLGDFYSDDFAIGSAALTGLTMALAKQATVPSDGPPIPPQGIIGLSFDSGEAQSRTMPYQNFMDLMTSEGVIAIRSYSLWLNDISASQGSILFGGVDTSKYTGDLVVLPLQLNPQNGELDSFTVTFAGLEIDGAGGKSVYSYSAALPAVLDSGSSAITLPEDLYMAILNGLGASQTQGVYLVPCSHRNTEGVFKFKFGNANSPAILSVPIRQFIIDLPAGASATVGGQAACLLGMSPGDASEGFLFGDTLLRAAYVVYNLDGRTLAIANTNFNGTDSKIQAITDKGTIPGATSTATGEWSTGTFSASSVASAWDLGKPAASGSGSSKSAAGMGSMPPSTPVVGVLAMGVVTLLGLLSGSMFVFL
jgi:hypothetical protein